MTPSNYIASSKRRKAWSKVWFSNGKNPIEGDVVQLQYSLNHNGIIFWNYDTKQINPLNDMWDEKNHVSSHFDITRDPNVISVHRLSSTFSCISKTVRDEISRNITFGNSPFSVLIGSEEQGDLKIKHSFFTKEATENFIENFIDRSFPIALISLIEEFIGTICPVFIRTA